MKINFIIPSWNYWKDPVRAQPLTQLYLDRLHRLYKKEMDTDKKNGIV